MAAKQTARRPHGTGALFTKTDKAGNVTWYGQFRVRGKLVKRKIGAKRAAGGRTGLTRAAAEKALRKLIEDTVAVPTKHLTVADVGDRLLKHLAAQNRKRATLMAYESLLRVHLVPFFQG